jgi:predicted pyridoxine 5'-phosphate oxidase superfamily flavin-nucleotide-binding protein
MVAEFAMITLGDDVRAMIDGQHLCFAATVSRDAKPNLSPKGTIRVWDASHIFFCDIASPNTRRNLERNPWIDVNVVDPVSRRGYRLFGKATLHREDEVYRKATDLIFEEEAAEYNVNCVVLVELSSVEPLYSPGYDHVSDEYAMRKMWKGRRSRMENEFEAHIAKRGPFRRNEK